ncbi:MAG TPA: hypothetical protein ENN44_02750 [Methanoculleus sp.]|nr:hypothetical protein [Methanoculleus sp.]
MIRKAVPVLLFVACIVASAAAAEGATIGGDIGYYQVNAIVDGAEVSFNDDYKGVTGDDGTLTVEVYVTGTPYTTYTVAKEGYETLTGEITQYPAKGETVQLQAELSPLTIGGDIGYYEVVANVDGAEVSFNDDVKGITGDDGTLTVEVYVTGTPYTSYSVAKEGYETFTGEITQYPAKGETVQLEADLVMTPVTQPTAEPTTELTQSPFPLAGLAGLAAFGVVLLSRRD